jgi:RNA polymerase sigma-70 factor (ECF subfamily)
MLPRPWPRADVILFPASQASVDPERAMAQRQLCQLVERAIDALPCEFRTVIIARVVEGISVEETAAAFDLQAETVKTRLHRARRMLKEALAEPRELRAYALKKVPRPSQAWRQ